MAATIHSPGQKALCAILIAERRQAGLTQMDLAERLRCHQSLIARIESGERRIDVIELIALSQAIGCAPEKILLEVASYVQPGHIL